MKYFRVLVWKWSVVRCIVLLFFLFIEVYCVLSLIRYLIELRVLFKDVKRIGVDFKLFLDLSFSNLGL